MIKLDIRIINYDKYSYSLHIYHPKIIKQFILIKKIFVNIKCVILHLLGLLRV